MEWIEPTYSKGQVDRAGFQLFGADANHFANTIESLTKVDNAYQIVGNWRSAHNYPLNIFQTGLRRRAKKIDVSAIVAQRIKRISSIHAKIARYPTMRLSMMQDIGGCRAVMNDVADVRTLVKSYKQSDLKHVLTQEDNYIDSPKTSGYRGIHLIYRYNSDKIKTFNGLKIEVQLRSTLQHAWATAVETVGTFIQQALKSSQGEADWLRFFSLMGSARRCPAFLSTLPGVVSEQASKHEHGKSDEVQARQRGGSSFVVTRQPPTSGQPCKGTLHDPAPW